jgi:hypothetical protein
VVSGRSLVGFAVILFTAIGLGGASAAAADLKADYQFQNSLASSVSGAPDLVPVGTSSGSFETQTVGGQSRTVYRFNGSAGTAAGLRAQTNGVISNSNYSIVFYAEFDALGSALAKLIDFKNLNSDAGLYNVANIPAFYDANTQVGSGLTPFPLTGDYGQLVLTRNSAGTVTVFLNGVSQFNFADTTGLAVIDDPNSTNEYLNFFLDDSQNTILTSGLNIENASGSIARLRLYDGALTSNEVAALDTVPEPASLGICGVLGVLMLRRRRAHE